MQTFTGLCEKRGEENVLIHLLWTVSLHVKNIVHKKTKAKHSSQSQYLSSKLYNDHGKIFLFKKHRTFFCLLIFLVRTLAEKRVPYVNPSGLWVLFRLMWWATEQISGDDAALITSHESDGGCLFPFLIAKDKGMHILIYIYIFNSYLPFVKNSLPLRVPTVKCHPETHKLYNTSRTEASFLSQIIPEFCFCECVERQMYFEMFALFKN